MIDVPRKPGSPDDEQLRLIAEAIEATEAWKKSEEEMWAAYKRARSGGVQVNHLLDAIGDTPSRATFFRHMKDGE